MKSKFVNFLLLRNVYICAKYLLLSITFPPYPTAKPMPIHFPAYEAAHKTAYRTPGLYHMDSGKTDSEDSD